MSTISSGLTGSSLAAYVQAAVTRAQAKAEAAGTDGSDASATTATTAKAAGTSAASRSAVLAASHGYQSSVAQGGLDRQQNALASELRAALAKTGVELGGAVSFGVSSAGKLVVSGSDADKAKVNSFLSADSSKPGFSSRLASLTSAAESLSGTIKQSAAISQAARYASGPSGLLSLYATLSKQQDATAASFTLSATGSSLTYAGVLTSKA
ncbi:hypothetical protein GT347_05630 [Xylophilus rhododendri]|uniref:Uncharacterized protein n=1 Tax=Xylophilus rhododendri TaxID=2697032 RepID=A0A857J385_9BURK|nr:hypothetical protein [Xylophilus rhododendri]QHI97511.1 hypothetical protein GT347_05630 [Xylophilus rhododendri]